VFALDTNAFIYLLKGMGNVRQRVERTHPSDLAVPAIVAYELEIGTLKSRNPEARRHELHRFLSVIAVLPFDKRAAESSARLRFDLEEAGQKIGPLDTLIAGTVLANGATLVTRNVAEFSRVPGLRVEDWF
jgi:tRNA(fMet)-specific endonuclease VapC